MLGHEFKSSYGYELTTIELRSLHYIINHKKVYRLMLEHNLLLNKKISTTGKRQFAKFRTIEAKYPMEYLCLTAELKKEEENENLNLNQLVKTVQSIGG